MVTQVVNPVVVTAVKPTFIALGSSPNPAALGQTVLVTAAVSSSAGGVPAGNVSFLDGSTVIGTIVLNGSGMATLNMSTLTAGTHPLMAQYFGDSNFTPSQSALLNQTVGTAAPQVTVQITPIPGNVAANGSVQFTATVENAGAGDVTWLLNGPGPWTPPENTPRPMPSLRRLSRLRRLRLPIRPRRRRCSSPSPRMR
mgnify:CR=1 FL=1